MPFKDLGLSDETLRAVDEAGYSEPTPIQAQAIPQVFMQRDVLGIAQTGTGKTASFTLPMIDLLAQGRARARMPRSLILEPTRELAAQVADNFEKYGVYHKLSMALLIGGVNFAEQDKAIDRGVDVLIATPGRLLDHLQRGKLMLNGIEILVIDEADRMLDMGFIPDVEKICERLSPNRQTLFFSATMPPPIEKLAKRFLNDPKQIEVSRPASTASTIDQRLVRVKPRGKRAALRTLMRHEEIKNAIIFCNRKRDVKEVCASLKRHEFDVEQLHGDMAQSERLKVLEAYKAGDIQTLVASDVAARGLDVADISHVFNFDVPSHPDDYVHRIGRTGRAGRLGKAFTLTAQTEDERKYLAAVHKLVGNEIPEIEGELRELIAAPEPRRSARKPEQADDRTSGSRRDTRSSKQSSAEPKSERGTANRRDGTRRDRYEPDEVNTIVGMGDHLPAFMAHPVKLSRR